MMGRPWLTVFTTFTVWCYATSTGKAHAATTATANSGVTLWQSGATMIGIGVAAATLIALALVLVVRPRRQTVGDRLMPFVSSLGHDGGASDDVASQQSSTALDAIERAFGDAGWWRRLDQKVELAEITPPTVKIVAGTALGTVMAVAVLGGVAHSPILALFGCMVPVVVNAAIGRKLRKRRGAFAEQLADNLQVLASSMRGGQSMAGGLEIVAEEAAEPARSEFRRIVAEDRLGIPLEEAIRIVARRMESRGMEQVALVAAIQREAGGNTADVLDRVVETMRERTELQRLVKTLTAQGRISRNVVSALPALLLLAISVLNPKYVSPLIHTSTGQFMLGLCVFLVVMGFLAISRIVNIKV
jgi:tight adherence protein B